MINDLKNTCCWENYQKLAEKIFNYLEEKMLSENRKYGKEEIKIILDDLKSYTNSEIIKYQQKLKGTVAKNLSQISEINIETHSSEKKSDPLNPSYAKKCMQVVPSIYNPQRIVVNNIKQIINTNNNSRNHKDIIHEDHESDQNKYNLNDLQRSDLSMNTDNTNNEILTTESYLNQKQTNKKSESIKIEKEIINQKNPANNIKDNETKTPSMLCVETRNIINKVRKSSTEKNSKIRNHSPKKKKIKSFSPSIKLTNKNIILNFNKIRFMTNEEYKKRLKHSYDHSILNKQQIGIKLTNINDINVKESENKSSFISNKKSRNNLHSTEWLRNLSILTTQNKNSFMKNRHLYDKIFFTANKESNCNDENSGNKSFNKLKNNINFSKLNSKLIYNDIIHNTTFINDNFEKRKNQSNKSLSKTLNLCNKDEANKNSKIIKNKTAIFKNLSRIDNNTTHNNFLKDTNKYLCKKDLEADSSNINKTSQCKENNTTKSYSKSKESLGNIKIDNSRKKLEMKNLNMSRNLNNLLINDTNITKSTNYQNHKNLKINNSREKDFKHYNNMIDSKNEIKIFEKSKNVKSRSKINKTNPPNCNPLSINQSSTMIFNNNFYNNLNYFTTFASKQATNEKINRPAFELNSRESNRNKTSVAHKPNDSVTGKIEINNFYNNSSSDIMLEIKKNMEENYKNFFNFSYDNYLYKDHSSDSRSDEIVITNESAVFRENL